MCGYIGRARININVLDFRKVDSAHRDKITIEIMSHFNVPYEFIQQVEHCALGKSMDAWRNSKHVLYKEYMYEGKDPFSAYTMITKPDLEEFKRGRPSMEFSLKSDMQSKLQRRYTHPHRMGVCGYYGKKPTWDKEDQEAVAARLPPPLVKLRVLVLDTSFGHVPQGMSKDYITLKNLRTKHYTIRW